MKSLMFSIGQIFLCISIFLFVPSLGCAKTAEYKKMITEEDLKDGITVYDGIGLCLTPGGSKEPSVFSCFNVNMVHGKPESRELYSVNKSFDELVDMFKGSEDDIDLGNLQAGLRSLEAGIYEKGDSLECNYIYYITNRVSVEAKGSGTDALSDVGKKIYDDGKFAEICGERLDYFDQIVTIIVSNTISFADKSQKENFKDSFAKHRDFSQAINEMQKSSLWQNDKVRIGIRAYQKGGDPVKLGRIIGKSYIGGYDNETSDLGEIIQSGVKVITDTMQKENSANS